MSARNRWSHRTWAASTVLLLASLAGCGGSDNPFADGCVAKIRYRDAIYAEVGFSSLTVRRAGRAQIAACPRGGATTTDVWSYPGRDPRDVLAVHVKGAVYRVLVAEGLPDSYTDGLHAAHLLNAGSD